MPLTLQPGRHPLGRRAPARQRPVERFGRRIDPMAQLVGMRPPSTPMRAQSSAMAWSRSRVPAPWPSGASAVEALVVGARHEPRPCRPPRRLVVARIEAERREAQCESRHSCSTIDARPSTMASPSPEGLEWPAAHEAKAASPGSRVLDGCTGEQPLDVVVTDGPSRRCPRSCGRWSTRHGQHPGSGGRPRRRSGGSRAGPDARATGRSTTSRWTRRRDAGPGRRPGRAPGPGERSRGPCTSIARAGAPAHRDARKRGDPQRSSACAERSRRSGGSPITRPVASSVVRA